MTPFALRMLRLDVAASCRRRGELEVARRILNQLAARWVMDPEKHEAPLPSCSVPAIRRTGYAGVGRGAADTWARCWPGMVTWPHVGDTWSRGTWMRWVSRAG